MLDRMRDNRRGAPYGASRPHFPKTLVLLDLPEAEGIPGKPIGVVGRHRAPGSPWLDRRRIAGVAGAVVIVIAGTVAGGSLAMHSPARSGVSQSQAPPPKIIVVHLVPSPSPVIPRKPRRSHPRATPSASVRPTVSAPAAHAPPPSALVVTYKVNSHWPGGMQGEIDITNNGSRPIAGWQIVVAMPRDQFTGWWNATGYSNNGILLLNQPSYVGPVAPHGGKWSVYFNANGSQTIPSACTFNGLTCDGL